MAAECLSEDVVVCKAAQVPENRPIAPIPNDIVDSGAWGDILLLLWLWLACTDTIVTDLVQSLLPLEGINDLPHSGMGTLQ